jgi:phosphomethylpyrimidine synthase
LSADSKSEKHGWPPFARYMRDEISSIGYKTVAFCSMGGPKFCSMNYSSKVDEYN